MKYLLVLAGLLALSCANPTVVNTAYDYHETIGVQEAIRIAKTEVALDFDGSRIIGGGAASLGEIPYLGGLVITLTDGRTSVCGSSLLTNTRAVTAAHCWNDGRNQARTFTVVLGSLLLFSGGTRISTSNVVMHPQWNPNTADSDVAIITISHVTLTNNIRTISLPTGSDLYVGITGVAAGYGATSDSQTGIPTNTVQRRVNLRVISNDVCRWSYAWISNNVICTETQGGWVSTCGGDSGGPLALGASTSATLIGITSFGHVQGCQSGHPAAFARVTAFSAWIRAFL